VGALLLARYRVSKRFIKSVNRFLSLDVCVTQLGGDVTSIGDCPPWDGQYVLELVLLMSWYAPGTETGIVGATAVR
jgi:hypothetical protein